MPRYWQIKDYKKSERIRTIDRLLDLRKALDVHVEPSRPDSLLLATWNIRDFDSNKFKHGPRLTESFHYIAEIISRFDMVAVQEVNRDLAPLRKLMYLLGSDWDYMVTGVTEGISGNEERMAFIFNTKRVRFTNLAGQVVLPRTRLVLTPSDKPESGYQFARAPYIASFQGGWFKFNLCTVHIYYGKESGDALKRRINEIKRIAEHFKDLQENKEPGDYILLGDFNIVSPEHQTMEALTANGFIVPKALQDFKTNLGKDRYYDQIAFKQHDKRLEFGKAGVFDFRTAVYRDEDYEEYYDYMPPDKRDFSGNNARTELGKRRYYNRQWITWQMSDHILLWVELKVDFTDDYLASLKPGIEPLADFPPDE